jgi:putative ABC transport system substrate-binding protein
MKRQHLALLIAFALLAAPLAAEAQSTGRLPRIGILPPGPLAPRTHVYDTFRKTLRELGYTEGRNIVLEFRPPLQEGDPLEHLAIELVRLNVDLIVATGDRAIRDDATI